MQDRWTDEGAAHALETWGATFGETLDEMRKRLGRIEMHLIDLREHLLPKREKTSK